MIWWRKSAGASACSRRRSPVCFGLAESNALSASRTSDNRMFAPLSSRRSQGASSTARASDAQEVRIARRSACEREGMVENFPGIAEGHGGGVAGAKHEDSACRGQRP
jgi:hypothetical protein